MADNAAKYEWSTIDCIDVQSLIAEIVENDERLDDLLDSIEATLPQWSEDHEHRLEAVYRTRLRHMFLPRQPEARVAAFSRHLHVAHLIFQNDHAMLSARLRAYELVLNDALQEIQTKASDRVLSRAHVKNVLRHLCMENGPVARETLRQQVDLEHPNFSRVIGVMEAAGLVVRSLVGREASLEITVLGRDLYSQTLVSPVPPSRIEAPARWSTRRVEALIKTAMVIEVSGPLPAELVAHDSDILSKRQIVLIGYSEAGAFISCADRSFSVVIPTDGTRAVMLMQEIFGERQWQTLNLDRSLKFILHATDGFSLEPTSGWIISLRLSASQTINVGLWNRDYWEIQQWIDNVNTRLKGARRSFSVVQSYSEDTVTHTTDGEAISNSPTLMRIRDRGLIRALPGYSIPLLRGVESENKFTTPWMQEFAENVARIVAQELNLIKSLEVCIEQWPDGETWDTAYRRVLNRERLDSRFLELICEFMFLDEGRMGRYEVVDVGTLNSFAMLVPRTNPSLSRKRYPQIFDNNDPFAAFSDWLSWMKQNADSALLITQAATSVDNVIHEQIACGQWNSEQHQKFAHRRELVDILIRNRSDSVVLIDYILVKEVVEFCRASGVGGHEDPVRVPYESPVRIGFPVDRLDPEWKGILLRAYQSMLNSPHEITRKSWDQTVRELAKVGVELDRVAEERIFPIVSNGMLSAN